MESWDQFQRLEESRSLEFQHGGKWQLPEGATLLSSCHPSPQNAQTWKLMRFMFHDIFRRARQIIGVCFLPMMLAGLMAAHAFSQAPTIRVDSNIVLTPVAIADAEGKAVRNLKLEDFEIEENGVRIAAARLGEPGEAPLEFAMLFDISGTMYPRFELEREAAARFLRRMMRPYDSAFIIAVANKPEVLQERTSSLEAALQAINRIGPTKQATALYNAVVQASRTLRAVERPDARRVIVALTDGEDNHSIENRLEDVLKELDLSNGLFYSINPAGKSYKKNAISLRAEEGLEKLSSQTGGASFVADNVEALSAFYDRIADELQEQYLLGYYSPAVSGPGIYRRIVIKVRGKPEFRVKARQGYFPK
jgi:Ca-activated chloride channel homolog